MSKPILWLGPLEELDVDYDPLLGRSAATPSKQNEAKSAPIALDPSRSVFDEPLVTVVPPLAAQAPEENPQQLNVTHSEAELSEYDGAPQPDAQSTLEIEDVAANRPADTILAPIETPNVAATAEPSTDFSHNNDPIPARHVQGEDASPEAAEAATSVDKKSFFTSLFTKRTAAAAAVTAGASINDIWAKSEPVDAEDVVTDETPQTTTEAASTADADEGIAKPDPRDNIWSEIETQSAASPTVDEAETVPEALVAETEPPFVAPQSDQETPNDNVEPDVSDAHVAEDETTPVDDVSQEIDVIVTNAAAPELPDAEPEIQPEEAMPEPIVAMHTPPETPPQETLASELEAAEPSSLQKAFNADNFWAIPASHKRASSPQETAGQIERAETSEMLPPDSNALIDDDAPSLEPEREEALTTADDGPLAPVQTAAQSEPVVRKRPRPNTGGNRRKKKVKKNYVGAFLGTFIFGVAAFMTAASFAAPLGYPLDLLSSFRWYWTTMAVIAAAIWSITRGWKMVIASFALIAANLMVTVPASGKAPVGGKTATAVVGWGNVGNDQEALTRLLTEADKKQATLLMIADAPASILTPPAGWTLIEAPVANDATAIAVLTKSTWRAVTVPGEPTMARPAAGDITVIGIHPLDAVKSKRNTPARDALINRAATRAGSQEGATIVFGDFNAPAWDRGLDQFRRVGNVTRVRCGGWAGSTLSKGLGIFGVASDHAFVRDVRVTHCQLGATLPVSHHKPIWLFVVPEIAPAEEAAQP
jgi:hypothetical protein